MNQEEQSIDRTYVYQKQKDQKNSILVSVIVPVYNVKNYISQCLESIIRQTYNNLEVLIIDDGSNDGSELICDEFADDSRIRVFHLENHGVSYARNHGIHNAKGDYITFIDSDDWVNDNAIEILIKAALNTNADIVSAQSSNELIGKTIQPKLRLETITSFQGSDILKAYSRGLFPDYVWNKLYRREIFDNIRFPENRNFEDCDIMWRIVMDLVQKDRVLTIIPEVLYHYRMRKGSISRTYSLKNIDDYWKACSEKFKGLPILHEELLSECMMVIGRMWLNYCSFSKEEKNNASLLLQEMQSFSNEHRDEIMTRNYPRSVRLACSISKHRSWIVMKLCHIAGRIRLARKPSIPNLYE